MPKPLPVTFVGGDHGAWRIESMHAVSGAGLQPAASLQIAEGPWPFGLSGAWLLRGVTSNERYASRSEHDLMVARQEPLARPGATCAALIPLRKSPAWWDLAQDERRAILEERSHHIALGAAYLPVIARRLHHSRDLGEPFDFLTWFEFAPADAAAFDELVGRLRATEEWAYVDREVEIRLVRGS